MSSNPRGNADKLRILALHGFRGSGAALRRQMRAFSAGLADEAEFVFVDAPTRADGGVGWWRALEESDPNGSPLKRYDGWDKSRDFVAECCRLERPFDGVFGFSQGATLAGLLVALQAPSFEFAILVGGFASADAAHVPLYRPGVFQVPSLHLIGLADNVVPPERSRALALSFHKPLILEHEGGHIVPAGGQVLSGTQAFLRQMRTR
ncbi:MAG: alpha/beta hydrolase [Polyangiaceae bacterium]